MRHARMGFLITAGAILAVDVAILALLDRESDSVRSVYWLVNFPGVSCIFCCAGPPPLGESEIGPWDYLALAASVIGSCLAWGLLGGAFGWLIGHYPGASGTSGDAAPTDGSLKDRPLDEDGLHY